MAGRVHEEAARGFARSADAYERARPEYPAEAVAWLAERTGLRPGGRWSTWRPGRAS